MFPFDTLDQFLTRRYWDLCNEHGKVPSKTAARLIGCPSSCVRRWRKTGRLMPATADKLATRLGVHPITLWPDEWQRHLNAPARPDPKPKVAA